MQRSKFTNPNRPSHLILASCWFGLTASTTLGLTACNGTGSPLPSPSGAIKLVAPEDVAIGPDGGVFFSDFGANRVLELRANGQLLVVAGTRKADETGDGGPAVAAALKGPAGLAFDASGNLYVADHDGGHIRRIDSQGVISTAGGTSDVTFEFPVGLAVEQNGMLLVADEGDHRLWEIDSSGSPAVRPVPEITPRYLALSSSGDVYIADGRTYGGSVGCRIWRMTIQDGTLSVIAGTGQCGFKGDGEPATVAQLDDPNGLAFDSAGNLYVADTNNHRIRRIDRNGVITTVAGTGTPGSDGDNGPATRAELTSPFGIAISPRGLLYIADGGAKRIRALNISTGTITTAAA